MLEHVFPGAEVPGNIFLLCVDTDQLFNALYWVWNWILAVTGSASTAVLPQVIPFLLFFPYSDVGIVFVPVQRL